MNLDEITIPSYRKENIMAKQPQWQVTYDSIEEIGEGGNAKVFHVEEKATHQQFALKELYNRNSEKKIRFTSEIDIASQNAPIIPGIIPIIDFNKDEYWYTMPIAQSVSEYINNNKCSVKSIVEGFVQLCETLESLHQKGITHRDIKPSNIYYYDQQFSLGDFGLVDFPDSPELTKSDKGLGAIFTIAPEMKRDPKHADGKKADVFSLAKTLWMLLVDDETGFDGVYNSSDPKIGLAFFESLKGTHLVEIEDLLEISTNNDPLLRPTIAEFKNELLKWIDVYSDYEKSQQSGWENLRKRIFGSTPADSSSWRDIDQIIKVLNIIGGISSFNHLFFSDGGGLDFVYSEKAKETGCIAFYTELGFCYLAKPKRLIYENIGGNHKWDYFLLEFDTLPKIIDCNTDDLNYEYLVEDKPGHYVNADCAQYGVYDYDSGIPLPDGYRVVRRYNKGKVLIVLKNGYYNLIPSTYDGRHGQCSSDEFREYISKLSEQYNAIYEVAKKEPELEVLPEDELERRILATSVFAPNPFSNQPKFVPQTIIKADVEQFIESEYHKWNFKSAFSQITGNSPIRFYFRFSIHIATFPPIENKKYVYDDGYIREESESEAHQKYYICDRENALVIHNNLEKMIRDILAANDLEPDSCHSSYIDIELAKAGSPTHLFTEQEIRELMLNADDRKRNQLVIDEFGFAQIITDDFGLLYPVRHEGWDAGNKYVGQYSSLETVHEDYIEMLQGWLIYLRTGKSQYVSYVSSTYNDENQLIQLIHEFY